MQLINIMDKLWLQSNLDLKIVTFACIPTGDKRGEVPICRCIISTNVKYSIHQLLDISTPRADAGTVYTIFYPILLYSLPVYSHLFYPVLFFSILLDSILLCSLLLYNIILRLQCRYDRTDQRMRDVTQDTDVQRNHRLVQRPAARQLAAETQSHPLRIQQGQRPLPPNHRLPTASLPPPHHRLPTALILPPPSYCCLPTAASLLLPPYRCLSTTASLPPPPY